MIGVMWTLLLFEVLPVVAIVCGVSGAVVTFPYEDQEAQRRLLPVLILPVPAALALMWAVAFGGQAAASRGAADWRTWFIYLMIVASLALPVVVARDAGPVRRFIQCLGLAMTGLTIVAGFLALMVVTDSYV